MGPKRSASSRESQYDPAFTSANRAKFYETVKTKGNVIKERPVGILPERDEWGISRALAKRKWEILCGPDRVGCVNLVSEFYANAKLEEGEPAPTFISSFRGVKINYGPEAIRKLLKLPTPQADLAMFGHNGPDYHSLLENYPYDDVLASIAAPGADWEKSAGTKTPRYFYRPYLKAHARVWCHFVLDTIIPNSNKTEIGKEAALCIHCLKKELPIDVARIISNKIHAIVNGTKRKSIGLAYPNLITKLVQTKMGTKAPPVEVEVQTWPIFTVEAAQKVQSAHAAKLKEMGNIATFLSKGRHFNSRANSKARTAAIESSQSEFDENWEKISHGRLFTRLDHIQHNQEVIWRHLGVNDPDFWSPIASTPLERQLMALSVNEEAGGSSSGAAAGADNEDHYDPMM